MPDEGHKDSAVRARFQQNGTESVNAYKSHDFRSVYVNNSVFGISAFDIAVTLGEIQGLDKNRLIVEQKVKVVMSPLHAKVFANSMAHNIRLFEQQYGEIKMPSAQATVGSGADVDTSSSRNRVGILPGTSAPDAKNRP